jgi:hypothetical protein
VRHLAKPGSALNEPELIDRVRAELAAAPRSAALAA